MLTHEYVLDYILAEIDAGISLDGEFHRYTLRLETCTIEVEARAILKPEYDSTGEYRGTWGATGRYQIKSVTSI